MKKMLIEVPDDVAAALEQYAADTGIKSQRAAAVALIAAALGIEYNAPVHGGWRGNPASLEALIRRADDVTDKGRNDPESG